MQERKHINEEAWIAWEQYVELLEHTCQCTACADRLASIVEAQIDTDMGMVQPPTYLAEEIRERVRRPDVQAAKVMKQTSKRMQLFLYSLRVGAAVLASILILSATSKVSWGDLVDQIPDMKQEESIFDKVTEAKDSLSEKVNEFKNQLFQGGIKND